MSNITIFQIVKVLITKTMITNALIATFSNCKSLQLQLPGSQRPKKASINNNLMKNS